MNKCEITPDECVSQIKSVQLKQHNINNIVSMISEINKLPDLPGKDIFVSELNKVVEHDKKSLSDTVDKLEKCGCEDARVSLLFV